MAQLCLLLSATSQLLKFKAEKGELWRSFETTFLLKRQSIRLALFPLLNQKMALLRCLEGKAAWAYDLCGEGMALFNAPDMEAFINELRNIFQPPAKLELSRIEFKGLKQGAQTHITAYHLVKMVA